MADESFRIGGLDFLRGCAVMGILFPNIVLFGLPSAALFNPFTVGTTGTGDLAAWLFNFLLVDGKMRAIFAMLLGASTLLVMESAEMSGRDGMRAHRLRMLWLLPIGLAHHLLLWSGDILLMLALCGLIATLFVRLETLGLIKLSLGLLVLQTIIDLSVTLPGFGVRAAAAAPGASAAAVARWQGYADQLGIGESGAVAREIIRYRSGYGEIFGERFASFASDMLGQLVYFLPEMLAFTALGMAMLKGGFLAGQWAVSHYQATWRRALLVGLVPMGGLAIWVLVSHDPLAAQSAAFGWSIPLRLPIAVGLAALAMGIAAARSQSLPVRLIESVGRLALSNYLLTSLAMTTLFYGYGAGLFGRLDRAGLMLVAVAMMAVMIAWSTLWRRQFGQGPAERLWRWAARRSG
ncbi:DUF418 domain-containing protein [Sphingobium lignivorans]|uniref:DUF418 domain-containing protein n=1 Tax=Sphingobium lignivorans TaxID=2735886 RepID=A0ABR6NIE2_9SPHN|nr:DUF418 domain-containing protein [Sphingobium lignivorans]MBB5987055.1 uncharacterized protein [Sphingobium lignivorans]